LAQLTDFLPNSKVIDGEILAFTGEVPLSVNARQKRIGRKTAPTKYWPKSP
jgi:DNA ligase-1